MDDELSARQFLRKRLALYADIEVVGEFESNYEAIMACQRLRPDVIFLDINMPRSSGLELPDLLPLKSRPAIVFVTAHDEHALQAFEVDAIDYLLKPYSAQRIAATLVKLRLHFLGRVALATQTSRPLESETQASSLTMVREDDQLIQLDPTQIAVIKTEGDYTRLSLTTGKSHLLRQSLTRWAELLSPDIFLRVDRFRMLNVACVVKVKRVSRNKTVVSMMGLNEPKNLGRLAAIRLRQRMKERVIA